MVVWDGRSADATRRERASGPAPLYPALLPALDLLLPDRRLRLHPVDDVARAGERLAAVGRRYGDGHARLRERDRADPVLTGRGAEPMGLDCLGDDRAQLLLGHLGVGLVLEQLHV